MVDQLHVQVDIKKTHKQFKVTKAAIGDKNN